tara:strand:- start:813 stop:2108 length:1296 start_codon:yes stop_codon:yes gene_type:complete
MSYAFTGLFDSYGTANEIMRYIFDLESSYNFFPSVRNIPGAIIIFSFTLYPYVFLLAQTAFINQSRDLIDVSRTLGLSKKLTFLKVALPLAKPSIIAGLMLVAMETLSDFGAVEHFAIPTFTTGIFRSWFGMHDLTTAKQLAGFLFVIFLILIIIEKYSRKKMQYNFSFTSNRKLVPVQLKGIKNYLSFVLCGIPILIGFIIPFTQLLYWALVYKLDYFDSTFYESAYNTFLLTLISATACVSISLIINYVLRINKNSFLSFTNKIISSGYGIPGIVLALGVLDFFSIVNIYGNLVITGTIIGLIFAYSIKFYALPNLSIESGFRKINKSIDEISYTLGVSNFNLLRKVHAPLLKNSLQIALLLISIEIIKELPATLILRPFNFDTLSVSAYMYASDERMVEAAAPSIAIVLVTLIPILLLIKILSKESNE